MGIKKFLAAIGLSALLVSVGACAQSSAPQKGLEANTQKLVYLSSALCTQSYPKLTVDQCFDKIFHGMGSALDPHSQYLNKEEQEEDSVQSFGGVGMEISKLSPTFPVLVEAILSDTTPAAKAGIQSGDAITYINDVPARSLRTAGDAVRLIRGDVGTSVRLTIERRGVEKPMIFTIVREVINIVSVSGEILTDGNKRYGLIETKRFGEKFAEKLRNQYFKLAKDGAKLDGLIITVEDNPGGYLHEVIGSVDLFLDAKTIVLVRDNEGIAESPTANYEETLKTPGDITNGLPIVVVVNGSSASASEIFAGAMKHFGRALIAGTARTFGKGSIQTIIPLKDKSELHITIAEYLIGTEDDWIPVQCTAITPDVLFQYPGVSKKPRLTECEIAGSIHSGGPMKNAPAHISFSEKNPLAYQAGLAMLEAYKARMGPKRLAQQEKFKRLEKEAQEAKEKENQ